MSDWGIRLWPGWRVVRELGRGSYGTVYEIQRQNGPYIEKSALKIIHVPENQSELEQLRISGLKEESTENYLWHHVERIRDEIGLMQQFVGYSNIVSYEDYQIQKRAGSVGWDILIRMELLTPLQEYMKDNPFSDREVLKMGLDISQALTICHKAGIIHRDIKPQNIFVNKHGYFKLGDFGISRVMPEKGSEISFKGTVAYMAPETFSMKGTDARSDIYSLALVLYRILNGGREPFLLSPDFTPEQREAALNRRLAGTPIPMPQNGSNELKRVLAIALSPNPALRYQTAGDFHAALQRAGMGKASGNSYSPSDGARGLRNQTMQRVRSAATNIRRISESTHPQKRPVLLAIAGTCISIIFLILLYYSHENSSQYLRMQAHSYDQEQEEMQEDQWSETEQEEYSAEDEQEEMHEHEWIEATCTEPKTCEICGETEGKALGHDWMEATYDNPKTCRRCEETEGNVKGYVSFVTLTRGEYSEEPIDWQDYSIYPWYFKNKIKKCRKIKLGLSVTLDEGNVLGVFECWALADEEWEYIGNINVKEEDKEYVNTFVIDPSLDIEAVFFVPQELLTDEELSWMGTYYFYEAQTE